ncbi:MAG: TrmO family methyltransferase [Ilumatobacteraceae bacterium]
MNDQTNDPPSLTVEPIGQIFTAYTTTSSTPVQTALNSADQASVVLDEQYRSGLLELDGFDYAWLLTWMDPNPLDPAPPTLQQTPFLLTSTPRPIGLFAMRGPRRPNPIGLHLVRIVLLRPDGFDFAGVDMVNGTRLLDIKPWVAPLDTPHGMSPGAPVRNGWFDTVNLGRPHTPDSLRAAATD